MVREDQLNQLEVTPKLGVWPVSGRSSETAAFLAIVKYHRPVASRTIARWLQETLKSF